MRVLIVAPPKTGNSWLRCLFAILYDLEWLRDSPTERTPAALAAWVAAGAYPDQSVFHKHYDYSSEFVAIVTAIPAHLATILRDPYDQFVSLNFFVQTQAEAGLRKRDGARGDTDRMIGKPIDHPEVMASLADGFGSSLLKGIGWLESGRSVVIRYEALHADPVAELTRATDQIEPVPPELVARAIAACQAETMRQTHRGLHKRLRSATVGDWRNHLTEAHLAIFREHHADAIRRLGYEVR